MIEAIIFDFDGVVVDPVLFDRHGLEHPFAQKGLSFTQEIYRKYFAGRTLKEGLHDFLSIQGMEDELEDFIMLKKSHDDQYEEDISSYPDTVQFIQENKQKYIFALATGSRKANVEKALRKFHLEGAFAFIITSEDYRRGKPDPEVYALCLARLQLPKEKVVVIEDSPAGVTAAKRAGLRCIALTQTHTGDELQEADIVGESLQDPRIRAYIQHVNAA